MIQIQGDDLFLLTTEHSTYAFRATETGHLEHLHYGARLDLMEADALAEKREFPSGNLISLDADHPAVTLEDMRLEMSSYGKGDIREPFVEIVHPDGSVTSDFRFEKAELLDAAPEWDLPVSYEDKVPEQKSASDNADPAPGSSGSNSPQVLCVTLLDSFWNLTLELYYIVYEECDVICRRSRLINNGKAPVTIKRLMSTQIDLARNDIIFSSFHGAWAREMNRVDVPVPAGKYVNSSFTGSSSNRSNPFVMLHPQSTNESRGNCYGLNLIYSGNHYEALEVNSFGKSRYVAGINPQSFSWLLEPGGHFDSPEAVHTWSSQGYTGMSLQMHAFVREHVVRGEWKYKTRPVLLNSWEAAYFDFNEAKLLRLARAGRDAGIELFVMDDGWFGERNDDTSSLGDWDVNRKKLPGGLSGLSDKIHRMGLSFGIWVEPEMVNVKSRFYEAHPDWVMQIPGRPHSEGRNQRILDLANPAVVDAMTEKMTEVFSSARIEYVKWDMNRIFSDVYSPYLPPERQGETAHRYMLGLYRMMRTLTERFPHILFEGCAAGGNRFDLGILSFFPQIWASDNTDALCRAHIQEGYSYGYPMSTVSAHVSACPNHQTLRTTPLSTRFAVAAFGVLGYECNFCDLKKEDLEAIKLQISRYKEWRDVLQWGSFYRGKKMGNPLPSTDPSPFGWSGSQAGNRSLHEWTCVSKDKKAAAGLFMQELVLPNSPFARYHARGLDPDKVYHFGNDLIRQNLRNFGDLINTASPVHIKQDSHIHYALSKFVTMPGEQEDLLASGRLLMSSGVVLKQAFAGTGYNEEVRFFQDFSSRLYFMEAEE